MQLSTRHGNNSLRHTHGSNWIPTSESITLMYVYIPWVDAAQCHACSELHPPKVHTYDFNTHMDYSSAYLRWMQLHGCSHITLEAGPKVQLAHMKGPHHSLNLHTHTSKHFTHSVQHTSGSGAKGAGCAHGGPASLTHEGPASLLHSMSTFSSCVNTHTHKQTHKAYPCS
jgi:hypothetical protein